MSQQSEEAKGPDTIEGVSPPEGETPYVTARQILKRSDDLIEQELAEIEPRLKRTGHRKDTLMGLALSGGGIHSANFSLGVLQALAKHGVLNKMDYLSTVSGGGFVGASLSWWLHKDDSVGLDPDDFPFGSDQKPDTATDTPAQKRLRHLSQHTVDLAPSFYGLSSIVPWIFLNLAVLLLALIVVMMLLLWGSVELAEWFPEGGSDWMLEWLPQALLVECKDAFIFRNLLRLAVLLAVVFAIVCMNYSLRTAAARGATSSSRYVWIRLLERVTAYGLAMICMLFIVGTLPAVAKSLAETAGGAVIAGPGSVLVGLGSASWSFFKAGEKYAGKVPVGVLASLGAVFLVYGLLLTAYTYGAFLSTAYDGGGAFWSVLSAFAVLALLMGWFANINYISPQRNYRDRLMQTFLPNPRAALDNVAAAATEADPVRLSNVNNASDGRGPYHIVNTNVLLVNSQIRRWRIRGGDSFILSPLYCGSNATGWCTAHNFIDDGMTFASAMAISGAAGNPYVFFRNLDLTRNPLIATLMALVSQRLGYWAHHPCSPPQWSRRPNHFRPGMYEFGNLINIGGLREDRSFVQLSDGGHFENLALYELIRRKLRLIICANPDLKIADLQKLTDLMREDFGARIRLEGDLKPDIVVVDIVYHDGTQGKLILLKSLRPPPIKYYRELGHHIGQEMVFALNLPQFIEDIEKAAGKYVPMPSSG